MALVITPAFVVSAAGIVASVPEEEVIIVFVGDSVVPRSVDPLPPLADTIGFAGSVLSTVTLVPATTDCTPPLLELELDDTPPITVILSGATERPLGESGSSLNCIYSLV
jgi:hypothetical protein